MADLKKACAKRGEYLERLDGDELLDLAYEAVDEINNLNGQIHTMTLGLVQARTDLTRLVDQMEFDRGFNDA